jgi:methanogenic corrinoid protein MtbC1
LLTPAARDLGLMWEDDTVSFVDVTTGLGLLHTLLYRLANIFRASGSMIDPSRRILLASLSGEQHNFGLQMVAELFRQSNWEVTVEPSIAEADLAQRVSETSFAIVGLSLADNLQTSQLAHAIRELRKTSANETIGVIVGGPVFVAQPDLASLIGADLTAHDAEQAVFRAEGLRALLATGI